MSARPFPGVPSLGTAALGIAAALTAAILLPAPARAQSAQQDPPDTLRRDETVIVTATRLPESPERVGSSVTVITADEIEASGARWLSDLLERVPGVSLVRSGGPGAVTSVFLRGTNSNQTLVLINGLRANAPGTGAYDLSKLPASRVERVEVLRGPQSTLYGSEAIGGVINVITKRGAGAPILDASLDGGSYGTARGTFGLRGASGATRYSLGADLFRNDGISAADAAAGNDERDGFRNTSLDGRVEWGGDEGWGADASVNWFDGRTRIDGYDFLAGPIDDPAQLQNSRELYAGLGLRYARGLYGGRAVASSTRQKLGTVDPDGFTTAFDVDARIDEIDLQNDLRWSDGQTTTVGVEHRRETASSASTSTFGVDGYDERVRVTGVYAQHRLSVGGLEVAAGLRRDEHSRFGGRTTYRATAAYNAPSGLRAHGSVGSGFRAPNFNELFYPGFGNPDLGPETSVGWDLGMGGSFADGKIGVDVTWFRNDVEGLVEFLFPGGFVNLGQVRTQGLEAAMGLSPARRLRVDLAYTFTDAKQQDSDVQLLRRPRHQGSVAARWEATDRLQLFAGFRARGARNDVGTLGTVRLEPYAVIDLAARYRLTPAFELFTRIDNLTDTHYQEVWGYGAVGLSATAGVSYRWQGR